MDDTFGRARLIADLYNQEGNREFAYDDATGKTVKTGGSIKGNLSIGIGHNLAAQGLTQDERDYILNNDISETVALLDANIPWWRELDEVRQNVLVNMCFNMGWGDGKHGLSSFRNTLDAFRRKDFRAAAEGIRNSRAYTQAPRRYVKIAAMVDTGEYN